MNTFTVILNPRAGRGEGEKLSGPLERLLRDNNARFEMLRTTRPGEATELARGASTPVVVAVGGDGTVHEVANGVIGSGRTLGVIPAGSGNDFIKSIAIPRNLREAVKKLLAGTTKTIDVGTVECGGRAGDHSNFHERFFVNGVGIGFDAAVAKRTSQIRFLRGIPLYLAAVFDTLGKYRAPVYDVKFDEFSSSARYLLIAVGNGPCAGGGFYLTPDALVDDGLLDVCMVDDVNLPTILRLMPKVMRGKHRNASEVKFLRGRKISVQSSGRFCVHADGEIVGDQVQSVRIELIQKHLSVIVG